MSEMIPLPADVFFNSVEFRAINTVAVSTSPFTYTEQTFRYPGQRWEVDITIAPSDRDRSAKVAAWLLSLEGRLNTFEFGDPNATKPRGEAQSSDVVEVTKADKNTNTIEVTARNSNGQAITVKDNYFLPGDYVSLHGQLFKVLNAANTDLSGGTEIKVWPKIRYNFVANAKLTHHNAKGLFRLSSNESSYNINEGSLYGISFGATEVVQITNPDA